ncbi:MAG: glycoside hydrolase family 99-like domain-containing protein [Lachnospiraceae bacterium]|nr:glycoside hydrolase family 99-like domain-containing protein [Lachnospiraceae bacterium]
MKFIAYYLPQFHEIEENNKWWGKGFTEWTNVNKAKPLFKGHYQPHKPYNNELYDLMNKDTVIKQTELMKKYNIYGFAYYHYWFNGKMLLEKPVENLLKWKEIDQRYFFFWANHSWVKSVNGKQTILQEQVYNGEKDWYNHFQYFLPYFKDERYVKVEGKPVIGIYLPKDISDYNEMIRYWMKLAEENGFPGIYIIESINQPQNTKTQTIADAEVLRQPNFGIYDLDRWYCRFRARPKLQKLIKKYYPFKIKYKKVIDAVIKSSQKYSSEKKVYYGTYCGWDNTSRHYKRGSVHTCINAIDFKRSIDEISRIAESDDFVFINAWNEWAEGMHLEPDIKNGFSLLEVLQGE